MYTQNKVCHEHLHPCQGCFTRMTPARDNWAEAEAVYYIARVGGSNWEAARA